MGQGLADAMTVQVGDWVRYNNINGDDELVIVLRVDGPSVNDWLPIERILEVRPPVKELP